jgi:putative chitinase
LNAPTGKRSAAAEPLLKRIDSDLASLNARQRASWLKIREQFTTQSEDVAGIGVLVSSIVGLVGEAIAVLPASVQRDTLQAKLDVLVERNAEMLLSTAGAPKNLDAQIVMRLAPNLDEAHAEAYASALQAAMQQYDIASLHARAMFIAQTGHETMNFRYLAELGGPSYFARYDGRKDLGNTSKGDGYRYRGRGFIQITGRANYAKAGAQLFPDDPHYLLDDPDAASQADVAARLAAWFWQTHDLNVIADKQPSSVAFREVTERINGGKVGYSDRVRLYTLVLPLL